MSSLHRLSLFVLIVACACTPALQEPAPATPEPADVAAGLALLPRLTGLWTGPATSRTALGDFPVMSMDLRDTDGTTLFAGGDLDARNSIRFAFAIERHADDAGADVPVLVFRNGGLFDGWKRDSRAQLMALDDEAGAARFCDVDRGCDYVDATWTVAGDELSLVTSVRGAPHMRWDAVRVEERSLPAPYPVDATPLAPDADVPALTSLTVTVTFPALAADADVWLLLTTTPCGLGFACSPSRSVRTSVAAGATEVDVRVEQLHPDTYFANAVLDRDRDMQATLAPTSGDGVAPLDTTADVAGDAVASLAIVLTVF